jgi:hypothetical protein
MSFSLSLDDPWRFPGNWLSVRGKKNASRIDALAALRHFKQDFKRPNHVTLKSLEAICALA